MRHPLQIPGRERTGTSHMGIMAMQQLEVFPKSRQALRYVMHRSGSGVHRELEGIVENPRVPIGSTGDEDRRGAGLAKHPRGIGCTEHIARADNGHPDAIGDGIDDAPIRRAAVELSSRATMDCNG